MAKVYGVVRVMNTLQQGRNVAGLEAGSAVLSQEATAAAAELYPNCAIAITNHHVVGEQSSVMCNFHFSQTPFPATVLKVCPQRDLAFLHIDTLSPYFQMANLDPQTNSQREIQLIESCALIDQPLDEFAAVTSVGYPSGTPHQTVTHGSLTAKDVLCDKLMHYHDCTINPGNSGGALLHEGMLVGINTAISTQPQSVSIATPVELVTSLLGFLKPQLEHPDLSHEAFRQLMAHYHVSSPPQELLARFEEHECGGVEDGVPVKFSQWFSEHCYDKPESHHLVQQVLTYLECGMPEKIHALREGGWVKCSSHSSACKGIQTQLVPDRIVFNEHFGVSATVPVLDKLTEKYGSEGVVITNAQPHEGVQDGEVLLKIDNRQLDNFGNFLDNGAPYFTAFQFSPGEPVELTIGAEDGVKNVEYTYNLVETIPRIHAPQLTPFEAAAVVKIGGLTITQMNAAMAARYPKYLKAPFNDAVVGVVVAVDAMSAEWHVQHLAPGALLTKVNGKELEGSIVESLQGGAKFLTFEMGEKSFIKLV
jgi:hypothetical protein